MAFELVQSGLDVVVASFSLVLALDARAMSLTQQDHGVGGLVVHPDGSVERSPIPRAPANSEFLDGVASADATMQVSGSHVLGARIFLPESAIRSRRLPLVLYFHGGGFVLLHADAYFYHKFCESVAKVARAIVVSVDYRLAPEHRIPAAYEDAVLALKWLQSQASESGQCGHKWLVSHADFSRCFIMGDSAGANIVHNVADHPSIGLVVQGLVLIQPFFGGTERTALEIQMADDKYIPLAANDTLWRLALPEGADRDHPACNPLVANLMRMSSSLPRILVVVGGRDPMHERQLKYVEMMKAAGKDVKLVEYKSATHAFQLYKPAQAVQLLEELENFINTGSSSSSSSTSRL